MAVREALITPKSLPLAEGCVGAGTGAPVGKLGGPERCMKAGLGARAFQLGSLQVGAVSAVNAVGNVVDPERCMKAGLGARAFQLGSLQVGAVSAVNAVGNVVDPATLQPIAGMRTTANGLEIGDMEEAMLAMGVQVTMPLDRTNTTISCIVTNACLTKAQATKVAQMAADAYAEIGDMEEAMLAMGVQVTMPLDRTNTTISCIVTNACLTKAQATKVAQMAADAYAHAIRPTHMGEQVTMPLDRTNTTISCIVTNACLTKAQATKVAQMAADAYAHAIRPPHTPNDGDTIYVLANGSLGADTSARIPLDLIGLVATRALEAAIVAGCTEATALHGLPAHRDIAAPYSPIGPSSGPSKRPARAPRPSRHRGPLINDRILIRPIQAVRGQRPTPHRTSGRTRGVALG